MGDFIQGALDAGVLGIWFLLNLFGLTNHELFDSTKVGDGSYEFGYAFAALWWWLAWETITGIKRAIDD